MDADDEDVAVETVQIDVEHGSHEMRFCNVPTRSEESDGTAVFAGLKIHTEPDRSGWS